MNSWCVCVCVCACRKVVEHGLYMKVPKVEVYLLEFKLSLHPKLNEPVNMSLSRADTIGTQLTLLSFICLFVSLPLLHLSTFSLLSPFCINPS